MTRCPFSLSRLVKVTDTGQVVYKAEKQACRVFPAPRSRGLESGAKRNFQILDPLDFLAEFTQHIPPKGSHLIRYYGHYSNKSRGMRKKAAAEQAKKAGKSSGGDDPSSAARTGCNKTWAMLIKRVHEVDPLSCPRCATERKVVAFIDPPQGEVIERILRHCGLWRRPAPRPPPAFRLCSPTSLVLWSHLTSHQRACQPYPQWGSLTVPEHNNAWGTDGISRFSRLEFPRMHRVFDSAASVRASP